MKNLADLFPPAIIADRYAAEEWPYFEWGHPRGSCVVNDDYGIAFLNIPKCASTSLKGALRPLGFTYRDDGQYFLPGDFKAFTIVRDPVDRYISAVMQWSKSAEADRSADDVLAEVIETGDVIVLDGHAVPQVSYLDPRVPLHRVFSLEHIGHVKPQLAEWGAIIQGISHENRSGRHSDADLREKLTPAVSCFYDLDVQLHQSAHAQRDACWIPRR